MVQEINVEQWEKKFINDFTRWKKCYRWPVVE